MKVNNIERWARLAFSTLVLLFAGIVYSWSILKLPFSTEFGWDAGSLGLNSTFTLVFFCIGGFISGLMTKKTSARLRMIISAVMLFAGFFITSRLNHNAKPVSLFLAYGFLGGTGIGIVYNTVVSTTNQWFPDKKGLCSGIMMMGFGLTTLIIGNIADRMIRSPDIGWRTTYLALAIIIGALFLIMAFVLKAPSPDTVFPQPKQKTGKPSKAQQQQIKPRDYTATEMIRRSSFWRIFLFITTVGAVGTASISFVTDILSEVGGSTSFVVTAAGVLSIFNGLGRLFIGSMFDAIGLRRAQYLMSAIFIIAPAVVVLALFTNSLVLAVVGMALCFFAYGFAPTTGAAFASGYFGEKHFSLNFSIVNLILIPAPFAAALAGNMYERTGSFISTFAILIGVAVIGVISLLSVRRP